MTFTRVLVTGATGFLGRALVERLVSLGYTVTALGKRPREFPCVPRAEYFFEDLAEGMSGLTVLAPWSWNAVINLAGPVPKKHTVLPEDYRILSDHVNISLNICKAIPAEWSGRFIHISSMNVYGHPQYLPVDETHPSSPINVYAAAKALTDEIVLSFMRRENVDCWVLRLPGLFSETRHAGAIYNFLLAAAEGRALVISAAQATPWDILHVDDAVEAIVRALISDERAPGPVNISYGEPVELVAMAEQIAALAGTKASVRNVGGVGHPAFQMNIEKARRLLDWQPTTLQARLESVWRGLRCKVTPEA